MRSRIAEAGDGSGAGERYRRGLELLVEGRQAEAAVDLLEVSELVVCPWALREGIILHRMDGLEP